MFDSKRNKEAAIKILTTSIQLISRGWTTDVMSYKDEVGIIKYCAVGAINKSRRQLRHKTSSPSTLARYEVNSLIPSDLITFNDAQTSPEPVIKIFKQAIKKLRG